MSVTLSEGGEVRRYTVEAGFDKAGVTVALPRQHEPYVSLRIESPTFKPSETGSRDPRSLGVTVFTLRVGDIVLQR